MTNRQYSKGQIFADDVFLVKIKQDKWNENKIWKISDFPDINIKNIQRTKYSERELEVYLNEFGDDKLHEAIESIKKYDIVESVSKINLTRSY